MLVYFVLKNHRVENLIKIGDRPVKNIIHPENLIGYLPVYSDRNSAEKDYPGAEIMTGTIDD